MEKSICQFLLLFSLLTTSPVFARAMPETLHTSSAAFTVYVAGPNEAREGIVLVHDWFGVSPSFLESRERLAKLGYRVVGSLDAHFAAERIDAAIQSLSTPRRKLAVMGFGIGAKQALSAALRNQSVRATVLWYGETLNDPNELKSLQGPVLLIVGSANGPTAAENASAFSKAADAAGAGAEVYVYPGAAHAFAQPLFN